jgi:glycine reductase complex component B subunit gamma
MPVAFITAMSVMAKQLGANRIVTGTKIPHPCGDPTLTPEADRAVRREIVKTALTALQTDVTGPTVFTPNIIYTSG